MSTIPGSTYSVGLKSVRANELQNVGEGHFEVRVKVQEGNTTKFWPSASSFANIDRNGTFDIDFEINTYTVSSGTITKIFEITVREDDRGGFNGKDDIGHGTIPFVMEPNLGSVYEETEIPLLRPDGNFQGSVIVGLARSRIA
jgi:hypothetical protein